VAVVLAWLFAGVTVVLGLLLVLVGRERSSLKQTERRSRLSAEHARLHLSVLARAGDEMSGALESYEDAIKRLAAVVVPSFADWFAVDLLDDAGEVQRVAAAGSTGLVAGGRPHLHPEGDALVKRVIETGRDEVSATFPDANSSTSARTHDGALVGSETSAPPDPVSGVESMAIVAVHVRGLALGALSFVTGPGRRGYRLSDLETAHGLADRVAVAVERVLLWRESRGAEEAAIARADQLRRLTEAALAVNAPLAEAEILRVLADHARQVLGARRAAVCTIPRRQREGDPDDFQVLAAVCSPEVVATEIGEVVGTACDLVAEFERPLRSAGGRRSPLGVGPGDDGSGEALVEGLPDGVKLDSSRVPVGTEPWIAVPLPTPTGGSRRVIVAEGVSPTRLEAGSALPGGFGTPDESVLVLLAQIASVALVNADLYQEVRGSERRLRAVVESSPLAIAELAMNGAIRWCNRACEELLGVAGRVPEEGSTLRLRVHQDSAAAWEQLLVRSSDAAATLGADIRAVGPGEEVKELSVSSAPLFDNEGRVSGIMLVAQDVTEHRLVLEQIHQSERLASMARLAGGVAHDFNNLLTVILGASDLLSRREDADTRWIEEVEAIQRAGQRAATLTAQLLAIGRRRETEPEVLDPGDELSSMLPMLERVLGEDVRVVVAPQTDGSRIFLDPADLERAVLNLTINARDAMSGKGSFTLSTRVVDSDHRSGEAGVNPRKLVAVTAADTGEGMDEQTAAHCFEPFFSTKPEGRGTGLGLFAVQAIVTQAGGRVSVDTTPGRGTKITMWFPAADESEHAGATPSSR